jgi:hypothetical protein
MTISSSAGLPTRGCEGSVTRARKLNAPAVRQYWNPGAACVGRGCDRKTYQPMYDGWRYVNQLDCINRPGLREGWLCPRCAEVVSTSERERSP